MKKEKILAMIICIIILASFVSCQLTIEEQENYIKKQMDEYNQKLVDHFIENEEIFNKLVAIFAGAKDELAEFETVSLDVVNDGKSIYILDKKKKNETSTFTAEDDFFKSDLSQNITKPELDKIFITDDDFERIKDSYKLSKNAIKYWSFGYKSEDYMSFILNWSWGANINLIYSKSGELEPIEDYRIKVHKEYWLNDNWYILYYFIDR